MADDIEYEAGEGQGASIHVDRPEAGESQTIAVVPGLRVVLEFNPAAAKFSVAGDDFILTLDDGAQVVLAGLASAAQGADTPIIQIAGIEIDADALLAQALALSGGEAEPIETAAGEEGDDGESENGGTSRYDDTFGGLIVGLIKQGIIETGTEFGLRPIDGTGLMDRDAVEDLLGDLTGVTMADLQSMLMDDVARGELPEGLTILDLADLMTLQVSSGSSEGSNDKEGAEPGDEDSAQGVASEEQVAGADQQESGDESESSLAAAESTGGGDGFGSSAPEPEFESSLFAADSDDESDGGDESNGDGPVAGAAGSENFDAPEVGSNSGGSPQIAAVAVPAAPVNEFSVSAISDTDGAANSVGENAANGTAVGITASAGDADGSDSVTYTLSDDANGRFAIDGSTGVVIVLDTAQLDYEAATSHDIEVTATSTDGSATTQTYTVGLTNVNETPTDLTLAGGTVAENIASGTAVAELSTSDPDSGESFSYALTGGDTSLFEVVGNQIVLKTGAALDYETDTTHSLDVEVTDSGGHTYTETFTINVTDVAEGSGGDTFAAEVSSNSPVAHWRLSESSGTAAADETGNHDGSYENGVDVGAQAGPFAGISTLAADFDGSNDYVEVPYSSSFGLDDGTIQMWFQVDSTSGEGTLLSMESGSDDDGFFVRVKDDFIEFNFKGGGDDHFLYSNSGSIDANQWHDVSISWGSDGLKLYLDGTLVDTDGYSGGLTDIGEPLTIGASQESSDNGQANNLVKFFDGNISEVTVYDSQLSAGQIGDLIDAGENGSDTAPDATLYGASFGDTITGDAAANTISGLGGDDLLDGSVGADLIYGGADDDVLIWDAADTVIDGGTGTDTLRVDAGDVDLTAFAGTIEGIEMIDMEADAGANSLTLTVSDVVNLSDTDVLTIDGDAGDSVDAGSGWTDGGVDGDYHVYIQGGATLNVDIDMTVNVDIV